MCHRPIWDPISVTVGNNLYVIEASSSAPHLYPFFFHKEGVQKTPEEPQLTRVIGTNLQTCPFTTLVPKNQQF
jgi:hypothetical protein